MLRVQLVLASLLLLTGPTPASERIKVSFGTAAPVSLSAAPVVVARQLGYFDAEGLDVEFKVFPGGANAVARTVNGQADVSLPGNEPVIIGKQPGRDPLPVKFFYNSSTYDIWQMVVLDGSRIHTLADLKGAKIGIFAPSASNVPQVRAVLSREGIDPNTQVTFRSIGLGAGALHALTSGAVDVVALYDSEHAGFETMGAKLRRLPLSPVLQKLFTNGLLTREATLADPVKRHMLIGFGRAYAKGTLFCQTNARACVETFWRA